MHNLRNSLTVTLLCEFKNSIDEKTYNFIYIHQLMHSSRLVHYTRETTHHHQQLFSLRCTKHERGDDKSVPNLHKNA